MSSARVAELGAVEGLISTTFPCIVVSGKGRPPLPPMTGGTVAQCWGCIGPSPCFTGTSANPPIRREMDLPMHDAQPRYDLQVWLMCVPCFFYAKHKAAVVVVVAVSLLHRTW